MPDVSTSPFYYVSHSVRNPTRCSIVACELDAALFMLHSSLLLLRVVDFVIVYVSLFHRVAYCLQANVGLLL